MKRRYSRQRFLAYAVVVSVGFAAIMARLVWIQLVDHEDWKNKSIRQSSRILPVTPRRGALLDRLGYPLALTEERYNVGVSKPADWRNDQGIQELAAALGRSPRQIRQSLRGRDKHTFLVKAVVLSPARVDSLRRVRGLSMETVLERRYPMDAVAARILGRVNHVGRGDAGVERLCDEILAGKVGEELHRFDGGQSRGTIMRVPLRPPVDGRDVVLTLDHRVQMILEEELLFTLNDVEAKAATGLVMDAWTGEVLAMATAPGIGSRDGRPYVSELWRDPAVLDGFEPGSSFKLFTAASLLGRALCDSSSIFEGHGDESMYRSKADMGGFFFHDVHPVGEVSLRVAFAVSSNIVFGTAASLLERQEFDDDLRRFGFGMSTGSGLPGETKGILRPASNWSDRSLPTLAIGQEISVSLFQLAAGFAALLTDGDLRVPRFVSSWYDENGMAHAVKTTTLRSRIVPPEIIPVLRDFCRGVVEEEYGSGTDARVEGLSVGGKTGTAQVSEKGVRGYVLDAYTANFVGVVPAEKPRLLCAIVVHRPEVEKRWGGTTAAGCFSRVISKILSGTELLDVSDVAQSAKHFVATDQLADVVVPRLVGLSATRAVQASLEAGLELASAPADSAARAVGQMPAAGSRVPSGAPIRVAWATGVRR